MANDYIINWSNGVLKAPFTLAGNTQDTTTTSLTLTGKGSSNWGEPLQENQLKLLEHFASDTSPANPTIGQLWYDSGTTTLWICEAVGPAVWRRVYTLSGLAKTSAPVTPGTGQLWFDLTTGIMKHWSGSEWIPMYSATSLTNETAPTSPKVGQLWYRTSLNTMYVYNGSAWVAIFTGNSISSASAPTAPVRGQLWFDTVNNVLKIYDNTNAFVPIAGGSFAITGDLNMNNFNIINLDAGVNPNDAINKTQLDNAISTVTNSITTVSTGLADRKVYRIFQTPQVGASATGTAGSTWAAPTFDATGSATTWPTHFGAFWPSISTIYATSGAMVITGPADGTPFRVQLRVRNWAVVANTSFIYNCASKVLVNGVCSAAVGTGGGWALTGDVGVMGSGGDMGAGFRPNNTNHVACTHDFNVRSLTQTFTNTVTLEIRSYAGCGTAGLNNVNYILGVDALIYVIVD